MAALPPGPVVLIGSSLGAFVAWHVAARAERRGTRAGRSPGAARAGPRPWTGARSPGCAEDGLRRWRETGDAGSVPSRLRRAGARRLRALRGRAPVRLAYRGRHRADADLPGTARRARRSADGRGVRGGAAQRHAAPVRRRSPAPGQPRPDLPRDRAPSSASAAWPDGADDAAHRRADDRPARRSTAAASRAVVLAHVAPAVGGEDALERPRAQRLDRGAALVHGRPRRGRSGCDGRPPASRRQKSTSSHQAGQNASSKPPSRSKTSARIIRQAAAGCSTSAGASGSRSRA